MLSYQHIYHAGNAADFHKHIVLCEMLAHMILKDKPLTYMETHAGRGLYNLSDPLAQKTNESISGIIKYQATLNPDSPYAKAIEITKNTYGKDFYPGSPMLAELILREIDRIRLMELHPKEHEILKANMNFSNVGIHFRDGYEGTLALSPPFPRRGLVLIDPSYEVKSEYQKVESYIRALKQKWPEAVILLWYPILETSLHKSMTANIKDIFSENSWSSEIQISSPHLRMIGSGLICINIPYGLEEKLKVRLKESNLYENVK